MRKTKQQGWEARWLEAKDFVEVFGTRSLLARYVASLQQEVEDKVFVAVCGLYSAGKSTFLNALLTEEWLPTSPIPTSANVVYIEHGDRPHIEMETTSGQKKTFSVTTREDIEYALLDGDKIERVHLRLPFQSNIPKSLCFLDTPGVDSTDPAHERRTEEAIMRADVCLFLSDYHHVLSGDGMKFLHRCFQEQVQTVFLINQIDKHNEEEMSFDTFLQQVKEGLHEANVNRLPLFTTSWKYRSHSFHQENELFQWLTTRAVKRSGDVRWELFLKACEQELTHAKEDVLSFAPETSNEELKERLAKLEEQHKQLQQKTANRKEQAKKRVDTFLHHLNLTPYEIRELAGSYLESRQKGFSVGLFSSAKKKARTQQERLDAFFDAFLSTVEAQAVLPFEKEMRTFFVQNDLVKQGDMPTRSVKEILKKEDIEAYVKEGASDSGDSLLHYTGSLSNHVKQQLKRWWLEATSLMDEVLTSTASSELQRIAEEKSLVVDELQKREQLQYELNSLDGWATALETLSSHQQQVGEVRGMQVLQWAEEKLMSATPHQKEDRLESVFHTTVEKGPVHTTQTSELIDWQAALPILEDIPLLESYAKRLVEKAKQLDNQTYTVTLFGAFSAGKSSVANALLGEEWIVSSPHPTTAAITEIRLPERAEDEETMFVRFKSWERLTNDLRPYFGDEYTVTNVSQLHKTLQVSSKKSPFLEALRTGLAEWGAAIGTDRHASLSELACFTAQERTSCFVDTVTLYKTCPLTEAGIVLRDTPGIDSVNTRHTSVAFDLLRTSDAILYVTYYSHAFARADEEFLRQIGRLLDGDAIGMLTFLVNAADLAETTEELDSVVKFVERELAKVGIRQPALYPISAKTALRNKKSGEEATQEFRQVEHRLYEEGPALAKEHVHTSARRLVKQAFKYLEETIEMSSSSKEEQQIQFTSLQDRVTVIQKELHKLSSTPFMTSVRKEAAELTYFVNQRVRLRFSEWFTESFYPGRLQGSMKAQQEGLQQAYNELIEHIAFEIVQEMRATFARLQQALEKTVSAWQEEWNDQFCFDERWLDQFEWDASRLQFDVPQPKTTLAGRKEMGWKKRYKGARAFFEQGGRKEIESLLQITLQEKWEQDVESICQEMLSTFVGSLELFVSEKRTAQMEALDSLLHDRKDVMEQSDKLPLLVEQKDKLQRFVTRSISRERREPLT